MAQTTYQVIVTGEDSATMKAGLEWAKTTYDQVVARYGLKYQQYKNGEQNGKAEDGVPTCQVHNVPMVKQQGKYGQFWSCHQRNADGSFCSYRPNGQQP